MSEAAELSKATLWAIKAMFSASLFALGLAVGIGESRTTAGALIDVGLVIYVLLLALAPGARHAPLALSLGGDIGSLLRSSIIVKAEVASFVVVDFITYSGHTAVLIDPTALIAIVEVAWALAKWAKVATRR